LTTFRELERRTAALASGFAELGLTRGTRVAVLSPNRAEVIETYLALGRVGAAFAPLNPTGVAAEQLVLADHAEVSAFVGAAADLDRVGVRSSGRPVLAFEDSWFKITASTDPPGPVAPADAGDILAVLHTSATTGQAKGVMTDHRSLRSITLGFLAETELEDDIVFLNCDPLYHGALVMPLIYLAAGATIVLMPSFTPQGCLATLERTRATHLWLVPEMLRFLLHARGLATADISSLREILYSAAPMPPDVLAAAHERIGCRFRQIYGMTEAGGPIAQLRPENHDFSPAGMLGRTRSVGSVLPGVSLVVLDENGAQLPAHAMGEVYLAGDGLMRGYLNDADATRDVLAGGWLRTGDLGRLDEDGFVYLVGRSKDIIVRGGQKVFPAEVERVLIEHQDIAEAAVVGVPDPDWGEVPVAFVAPVAGAKLSADEVLRFCVSRLDNYKRPIGIHVTTALPKNPAGKVLRRQLRAWLDAESPSEVRE